jgi:hypothetical protein
MPAKRKIGPFTSARMSAELAAEVLNGDKDAPDGENRQSYALYCIARALADMARAMDQQAAENDVDAQGRRG